MSAVQKHEKQLTLGHRYKIVLDLVVKLEIERRRQHFVLLILSKFKFD